MRPVRLSLKAFGPYAEKQVIDFRELCENAFFLIHGPTGSGKTSILDGITFALYGDTSTAERQARQMRSDYAPFNILTEVEFDFSLGDELYRIRRSPEQVIPKARGEGMTKTRPQATLWCRTGLMDNKSEGRVIAGTYSDATAEVEKILGFKAGQFKQVVVLPQGQFRDFLLAGSGKREEILEVLFKTGEYRNIQESLKEKAKDIRNKLESLSAIKETRLADSGVKSIDMLEELLQEAQNRLPEIAAGLRKAREEVDSARKKVQEGEAVLEKIREKEEAERLCLSLEARVDVYNEKERSLEKARKTLPLKEVENEYIKRVKEKEDASLRYEELTAALTKAEQEDILAQQEARETEKKRPRLAELVKEMTRLEEYREKAVFLAAARDEFKEAEKEFEKTDIRHKEIKELLKECDQEREKKETIFREKRDMTAGLSGLRESLKQLSDIYHDRLDLDNYTAEYGKAEKDRGKAMEECEQTKLRVINCKKEISELERVQQKGRAVLIAGSLVDGEPCPVCGSREHPAPAHTDEALPTEKDIAVMKMKLDEYEQAKQKHEHTLTVAMQRVTESKTKVDVLKKRLKDAAAEDPDIIRQNLEKKENELKNTEEAARSVSSLENEIILLKEREKKLKADLDNQEQAIIKVLEKKVGAESRVQELHTMIPPHFQSGSAVTASFHTLDKEKDTLEKQLEETKNLTDRTSREAVNLKGKLEEAEKKFMLAKAEAEAGKNKFEQSIINAGFSSIEEYKRASIPEQEMDILENHVREFSANLAAAKERFSRAVNQVKEMKAPDSDRLKETYNNASSLLESKIREEEMLVSEINQRAKSISDIKKMERELHDLESRHRVLGFISDIANGKNPMGMTFQRFIQVALLDDVLIAASRRLSIMSRGRFLLRRATEREDRRLAGGLNLEVDDGYTGKTRSVSTLSGGESFLAALSLALGLADIVQSYSGGVRLETLFVDEGFGSLDPESLDLALRALMDLQKGGRLVAIISHIPELKERIDARLEIIPGRSGSTARFSVT
ncbi:MAG: AAA family ATPase [Spirochaetales bacterium]|nr:AAA family ATPase [Spirochaetales bacterium]